MAGHKTGLYLDQQVNYQLVAALGQRRRRCWIASVSWAALGSTRARAGAAHVHCWTKAPMPSPAATRNAAANGLADQCSFETANVFDWLKAQTAVKPHERVIPRFDVIILDPPSFTRTRAAVPDAMRGYKEIHLRALKLLRPGGTLATLLLAPCGRRHVPGRDSGRRFRLSNILSLPTTFVRCLRLRFEN